MYKDIEVAKISSLEDEIIDRIYNHGDDDYAVKILMALRKKLREKIEKEIDYRKSEIEKSYLLLEQL